MNLLKNYSKIGLFFSFSLMVGTMFVGITNFGLNKVNATPLPRLQNHTLRLPGKLMFLNNHLGVIRVRTNSPLELRTDNVDVLGNGMVKYFTDWCPDAWCSGDFQHTAENFTYDAENKIWTMELSSYPRFVDNLTILPAANFSGEIKTVSIPALRSTCTFLSPDPRDMFEIDGSEMTGISDTMSEMLVTCTSNIEKALMQVPNSNPIVR